MPPITLQVEGLTARLPGGGPLVLDDVSFTVRRGWLVGVVGPTGAGKSSLLAALTGRLAASAGTVRVGGRAVATGTGVVPGVAHVPQDDVLHGRLGLRRTLHHAATLRLPRGTDGPARRGRIDQVLTDLGLADKARAAIDTLSGGERKRANVAVELVGQPDVVLLDEPTSGLDPGHEQAVLAALRQVADGGRTVVAVTHGLTALNQCDRVLVLGRGGRVVFFGPPAAARAFFGPLDAATLFRDLDSADSTTRWAHRFRTHPAYAQLIAGGTGVASASDAAPSNAASTRPRRRTQLATLVHRAIELTVADRRRLALLAMQGPVLGLLLLAVLQPHGFVVGFLGAPQATTVAMFLAVSATWLGAATAVREIVDELPIVRRERGAGLSLGAYVASKAIVLGTIAGAQAAALAAIAILRQDPPAAGAVLSSGVIEIVAVAGLVGVAAVALGLCVSAMVTTSEKALTVLPLVLVTQLVLAGPWSASSGTPGLELARSLSIARWGASAVEATAFGDRDGWWRAVLALVALTLGALLGTAVLVRRRAAGVRSRRAVGVTGTASSGRWGRPGRRGAVVVAGSAISAGSGGSAVSAVSAGSGGSGGSGRRPATTWIVPSLAAGMVVAALAWSPSSAGSTDAGTGPGTEVAAVGVRPALGGDDDEASGADSAPPAPTGDEAPPTTTTAVPPAGDGVANGAALVAQPVLRPVTTQAPPASTGGAVVGADGGAEPDPPVVALEPPPTTTPTTTPPPAPTTTTTAPPPSTTTTTAPPASSGGTRSTSGWDWVVYWWEVAQALRAYR